MIMLDSIVRHPPVTRSMVGIHRRVRAPVTRTLKSAPSRDCRVMAPAHPGLAAASTGWNGHTHGSSNYRKLLAGLFFAGIATLSQLYSAQAVLAQIADDVGVSAADAALVISASTLGLAVGVIPWSLAADRLGRVRAMSMAVIAATVFGLLVPFAPTVSLFSPVVSSKG